MLLTLEGHTSGVRWSCVSADGQWLVTASADKTAALWDALTGARVRQFKGHTAVVNAFCPARDANTCASASDDALPPRLGWRCRRTSARAPCRVEVMQLVLFCYYHTSMNMIGDNLPFLNRLV